MQDCHSYRIIAKITRGAIEVYDSVTIMRDIRNISKRDLSSAVSLMISQWCGDFINVINIESLTVKNVDDEFEFD